MDLSKKMREAIELLKKEEFYLWDTPTWSTWRAYGLPGQTIRTDTMKALERRGIVKIEIDSGRNISRVATLIPSGSGYGASLKGDGEVDG